MIKCGVVRCERYGVIPFADHTDNTKDKKKYKIYLHILVHKLIFSLIFRKSVVLSNLQEYQMLYICKADVFVIVLILMLESILNQIQCNVM